LLSLSVLQVLVVVDLPPAQAAGWGSWFCLVATVFTRESVRAAFLRHGHWVDRGLGVVFIVFAVSLALASVR